MTRGNNTHRAGVYAAIFFLFFLEITLFKRRVFGARPELLLIATVFFGLYFGPGRGIEAGIVSGALKDIFSINAFGVGIFAFLLIGCLAGFLKKKLTKESLITQFLFSSLSACIMAGIYFLYLSGILKAALGSDFWRLTALKGLYTGCAAPVIFFILQRVFKAKGR